MFSKNYKIILYFFNNLDSSLKILANRKKESLTSNNFFQKYSDNFKNKLFIKEYFFKKQILGKEQLETVKIIFFSFFKYIEYLLFKKKFIENQNQLNTKITEIYQPLTVKDFVLPEQKLNEESKENKIPNTRFGRLLSYGELAAGLGFGTFSELSKRKLGLSNNQNNPIFSDANANRIVKTLCKVRGAALKIGQILSIQDLINPQLQEIFERVRQSADYMSQAQLNKMLFQELGSNWLENFKEFNEKPFAAASIGQVHKGILLNNEKVAVKIQYPGVGEGIDSDIKNFITLLKIWNILPPGLFIDSIIKVAKNELKWELDYEREAKMMQNYKELINKHNINDYFYVPKIYENLSTKKILTTELIEGISIDKLNSSIFSHKIINDVCERLLKLSLYEIFIFKFMQTDPNWSNFFYNPKNGYIYLIDFGSARSYSDDFINKYLNILLAASKKNHEEIIEHSIKIGFLSGYENKEMIDAHLDSVLTLGKIFEQNKEFDFDKQKITLKIYQTVPVMLKNRLVPPPDEIYSLHRKLSGLFMLLTKLKAKINCKKLFNEIVIEKLNK